MMTSDIRSSDSSVQQPPSVADHKVHLQQTTIFKVTPMHSATVVIGHSQKSSESTRTKPHDIVPVEVSSHTLSKTVTSSSLTSSTENTLNRQGATNSANKETANQEIVVFSNPSSQQKCHQKLTLPEEIKETEYMSAIQKQKARVSRICRCIVAATVIQRAWRNYKDERLN